MIKRIRMRRLSTLKKDKNVASVVNEYLNDANIDLFESALKCYEAGRVAATNECLYLVSQTMEQASKNELLEEAEHVLKAANETIKKLDVIKATLLPFRLK